VLALQQEAQQEFGAALLRAHAASELLLDTNAPAAVEVTLLRATTGATQLIGLVNWQKELPNVPARDVSITVSVQQEPRSVRAVSGGSLAWTYSTGKLTLVVPFLETIEMIEIT
jgi:hypothetical protein